jgi:hypothetical protein
MFSPHVPSGFAKGLKIIDPTYRVEATEDHNGYFIIKDIDLSLKSDDGRSLPIIGKDVKTLRVRGPMPVLWIPDFGEQWLDVLRAMKMKGIELGVFDNPVNELAYYQKLKREARQKKRELAVDMISEGLMEAHRLSRKKSFSYGGTSGGKRA